jgi:predicted tellurium resistance membrane protein TerC
MPYLKLVGGVLLLWIGIKLLADNNERHAEIAASERLWTAVKTIMIADLVMSIDNVIAVASAAEQTGGRHQLALVAFGILVSIPIIVWGSTLVLKLMERLPIIITLGAALLGYLAGGMVFSDVALMPWIQANLPAHDFVLPGFNMHLSIPGMIGALAVVVVGNRRAKRSQPADG